MKKHFLKPALLVLMLAVLVGAIFGISALADSSSATATPEIVSKNVSYSSKLHLYYAVPVSSIEGTPSIKVYTTEPTDNATPDYTITSHTTQSISVITGEAEDYYVFRSHGVAAKDIANSVWAVPVSTKDGVETVGEPVEYSIAEYCFERLTRDGYLAVSKSEIKEYERRELYMSLLSYAYNAQQVLASDGTRTEIEDLAYYSITGSESDGCGFASSLTLKYKTDYKNAADGWNFAGWSVYTFNPATGKVSVDVLADGANAALTGAALITPEYNLTGTALYESQLAEQQKEDAAYIEYRWEVVEAKLVEQEYENVSEIIAALKQVYTMYNGDTTTLKRLDGDKFEVVAAPNGIADLVEWIAALYAKGYNNIPGKVWAGGFYANLDAVGTVGYGPDVQCTAQLLTFMQTSGMLDSVSAEIPEWMGTQIAYFAKTLQDTNGYFYHPQWGRSVGVSRVGRDLGWATTLLEYFGAAPTYDTPRGKAGDGLTAEEYKANRLEAGYEVEAPTAATAYITAPLSEGSVATAVSQVVLASDTEDSSTSVTTSVTSFSKYLVDGETFLDYLYANIDMLRNPYSAGNTLNANQGDIKAKSLDYEFAYDSSMLTYYEQYDGMNYREILITYLNNYINPKTGLFGGWNGAEDQITDNTVLDNADNWSDMSAVTNFTNSNGFFKVISIYNSWGFVFPEIERAFDSLMNNLTNPDVTTGNNACDVYNVWNALSSVRGQIKGQINAANGLLGVAGTPKSSYDINGVVDYSYGEDGALTDESNANLQAFVAELTAFYANFESSLKAAAKDAIDLTYERMNGYKAADGGFSHGYNRRVGTHQGAPVAPSGDKISDVDATCITSTGLVRSMFSALGLGDPIEFFGKSDFMQLVKLVEEAPEASKVNEAKSVENFEDYEVGANVGNTEDETSNTINIPNIKLVFNSSTSASAAIVEEGENKFLRFTDNQGEGIQTYPEFKKMAEVGISSVVFEAKMRFNQTAGTNYVPITLLNSNSKGAYYAALIVSGGKLYANVNATQSGRESIDGLTGIDYSADTWYTVKLEYNTAANYCAISINDTEMNSETIAITEDTIAASAVTVARMACNSNWQGTIDYDDVRFCSDTTYSGKCAHVIGTKYDITKEATCTEVGHRTHVTYCQVCNEILEYGESTDIEMLDHEFDTENSKAANAATCEAAGNHAYYYCTLCNNYVKSNSKEDAAYREYWTVSDEQTIDDVVATTQLDHVAGEEAKEYSVHTINSTLYYKGYICVNGCGDVVGTPDHIKTVTYTAPSNAFGFADFEDGDWTTNTEGSVLISHYAQKSGTTENLIVSEGDLKYLSLEKHTGADKNAQSWVIFQRTANVSSGPIVFEARMRMGLVSSGDQSAYIRFYDGRTTTDPNGGTVFAGASNAGRNIYFRIKNNKVLFNDVDLGVDPGEWFTFRLVLLGQTIVGTSMDAAGNVLKTVDIDRTGTWTEGLDLINCDSIVWMNDASTTIDMDFHSVYFAGTIHGDGKCTASEAVQENIVPATCTVDGSYDEVTYCASCGKELSREEKVISATGEHDPELVEAKAPTCAAAGNTEHYKCSLCGTLFSDAEGTTETTLEAVTLAIDPNAHTSGTAKEETWSMINGYQKYSVVRCVDCNEVVSSTAVGDFISTSVPHAAVTFDDMAEGSLVSITDGTSKNTNLNLAGGAIKAVYQEIQSGCTVETAIVSENSVKYLSIDKALLDGSTTSSQTWININLDSEKIADLETLVLEFRLRISITEDGSGYAFRTYTGNRTNSGSGTRITNHNFVQGLKFGGNILGVADGEWFTMRVTLSDYNSETQENNYIFEIYDPATGEYVTKYSTAVANLTDVSALTCVTFMDSTGTIVQSDFAYMYVGSGDIYYGECVAGEAVQENYVAPTCTEAGSYDAVQYCVHCGCEMSRTQEIVDATGHVTINPVAAKDPTCAAEGNIAHYKCADCGELFEDAAGSVTTTLADVTLPIDPTAHGNITSITEETPRIDAGGTRYYTVSTCDVCGNVTAEIPGAYEDVYKAPHYSQNFVDSDEGAWTNGNGTNVLIGKSGSTGSITVVSSTADGKYLAAAKTGTTAQYWPVFQRVSTLTAGADVVFEARMKWSGGVSGNTYIRFYDGRTAANPGSGGALFYDGSSNNSANLFIYESGGYVYMGESGATENIGVEAGTWFTLRLTMNDQKVIVQVIDYSGAAAHSLTVDFSGNFTTGLDLENCDAIAIFGNKANTFSADFASVYFGGTPVYEECTPSVTQEDHIAPTCVSAGGYYEVTRCADCGNFISKTWVTLEATGDHGVANGECVMCGDHFTYDQMINFESLEASSITSTKSTVATNDYISGVLVQRANAAYANASIISEYGNKYLQIQRIDNNNTSNTWIETYRDTTHTGDTIVYESRMRITFEAIGGGIYLRAYTDRVDASGGTRAIEPTMSCNSSTRKITYAGIATHALEGEWFSMRFEFTSSGAAFYILNETENAITVGETSYAPGEWVKYTTTAYKNSVSDQNAINCVTFMQATNSLSTIQMDDVFFGPAAEYVQCVAGEAAQETYIEPQCSTAGEARMITRCKDCGRIVEIGEEAIALEATGVHDWQLKEGYDATCVTDGCNDYYQCSDTNCGYLSTDGTDEGSTGEDSAWLPIPATGKHIVVDGACVQCNVAYTNSAAATFDDLTADTAFSGSYNGVTYTYHNVETHNVVTVEGDNKAINFVDTQSGTQEHFDMKFTNSNTSRETLVFETKMFVSTDASSERMELSFRHANDYRAFFVSMQADSNGAIKVGFGRNAASISTNATTGAWFTLRIEYTAVGGTLAAESFSTATPEKYEARIYVNGVNVATADINTNVGLANYAAAKDITWIKFVPVTAFTGTVMFDDLYMGDLPTYTATESAAAE